jgi:hypothetical protein
MTSSTSSKRHTPATTSSTDEPQPKRIRPTLASLSSSSSSLSSGKSEEDLPTVYSVEGLRSFAMAAGFERTDWPDFTTLVKYLNTYEPAYELAHELAHEPAALSTVGDDVRRMVLLDMKTLERYKVYIQLLELFGVYIHLRRDATSAAGYRAGRRLLETMFATNAIYHDARTKFMNATASDKYRAVIPKFIIQHFLKMQQIEQTGLHQYLSKHVSCLAIDDPNGIDVLIVDKLSSSSTTCDSSSVNNAVKIVSYYDLPDKQWTKIEATLDKINRLHIQADIDEQERQIESSIVPLGDQEEAFCRQWRNIIWWLRYGVTTQLPLHFTVDADVQDKVPIELRQNGCSLTLPCIIPVTVVEMFHISHDANEHQQWDRDRTDPTPFDVVYLRVQFDHPLTVMLGHSPQVLTDLHLSVPSRRIKRCVCGEYDDQPFRAWRQTCTDMQWSSDKFVAISGLTANLQLRKAFANFVQRYISTTLNTVLYSVRHQHSSMLLSTFIHIPEIGAIVFQYLRDEFIIIDYPQKYQPPHQPLDPFYCKHIYFLTHIDHVHGCFVNLGRSYFGGHV